MSTEGMPEGPDRDEMIRLIRDVFPDAVVAAMDGADGHDRLVDQRSRQC